MDTQRMVQFQCYCCAEGWSWAMAVDFFRRGEGGLGGERGMERGMERAGRGEGGEGGRAGRTGPEQLRGCADAAPARSTPGRSRRGGSSFRTKRRWLMFPCFLSAGRRPKPSVRRRVRRWRSASCPACSWSDGSLPRRWRQPRHGFMTSRCRQRVGRMARGMWAWIISSAPEMRAKDRPRQRRRLLAPTHVCAREGGLLRER